MKKVWILEKFETAEEMNKSYIDFKAMCDEAIVRKSSTDEQIASIEQAVANYKKTLDENPNGRWFGTEGKVIYKQFCEVAKANIRRNPNVKFRVVEGEIKDDAKFWTGYKVVKVNDGVLRYLMATK